MVKRYNIEMKPGESERQYYIRLAKATDQRLVRIEENSGFRGKPAAPGYENQYKFAYRKALSVLDEGQIRFNANIPTPGTGAYRERVNAMRTFLTSPTSTKTGTKMVYNKQVAGLNKAYGTNYTPEQLADFFEHGDYDRLHKDYGSATIFQAIATIHKSKDALKKGLDAHIAATKDEPSNEVALAILRKRSLYTYKSMTKEEREEIRKSLRSL